LSSIPDRIGSALAAWAEQSGLSIPSGYKPDTTRLVGDASYRIYVRVHLDEAVFGVPTAMAMVLPTGPTRSEEIGSDVDSDELPFVEMTRWLLTRGVAAPALYVHARDVDVLLLEDLSDRTFEGSLDGADWSQRYDAAIDLLVDFQRRTEAPEAGLIASKRAMDRDLLGWELEHYVEWRLEADLGCHLGPDKEAFTAAWQPLLDALCDMPVRLAHRDFQSRNIMCAPRGMVLIDYQDALMAPWVYDLVALLRDSYVVLEPAEVTRLVHRYAKAAREAGITELDAEATARHFHLQTIQRKLKDTGRFVYIDRVKGNPSFLGYRAPSMGYVRDAFAALGDELSDLRRLVDVYDPA